MNWNTIRKGLRIGIISLVLGAGNIACGPEDSSDFTALSSEMSQYNEGYTKITPEYPTTNDDLTGTFAGESEGLGFGWVINQGSMIFIGEDVGIPNVLSNYFTKLGDEVSCYVYVPFSDYDDMIGYETVNIVGE